MHLAGQSINQYLIDQHRVHRLPQYVVDVRIHQVSLVWRQWNCNPVHAFAGVINDITDCIFLLCTIIRTIIISPWQKSMSLHDKTEF